MTKEVRRMDSAAVSKLKAALSEYLRRVKSGEEILVTERGRPVAKLVPIAREDTIPTHLQEMEKQGLIKLGTGKLPKTFWNLPRPKDTKALALKALLEERRAGR